MSFLMPQIRPAAEACRCDAAFTAALLLDEALMFEKRERRFAVFGHGNRIEPHGRMGINVIDHLSRGERAIQRVCDLLRRRGKHGHAHEIGIATDGQVIGRNFVLRDVRHAIAGGEFHFDGFECAKKRRNIAGPDLRDDRRLTIIARERCDLLDELPARGGVAGARRKRQIVRSLSRRRRCRLGSWLRARLRRRGLRCGPGRRARAWLCRGRQHNRGSAAIHLSYATGPPNVPHPFSCGVPIVMAATNPFISPTSRVCRISLLGLRCR